MTVLTWRQESRSAGKEEAVGSFVPGLLWKLVAGALIAGSLAVNATGATGQATVTWTTTTGAAVSSTPVLDKKVVYVGSDDGKVDALNALSGAILWTTTTGGAVDSSPTVEKDVVYVGSDDGKVYALNALSGAILWTTTTGGAVDSSPIVENKNLYVGSDDAKTYALRLK
jgi:outer membrane protein assembly factor BamB